MLGARGPVDLLLPLALTAMTTPHPYATPAPPGEEAPAAAIGEASNVRQSRVGHDA